MRRVLLMSVLLIVGLLLSQLLPALIGAFPEWLTTLRQVLTMAFLAFIMIEVGREFDIDFENPGQYGKDYLVAATAAAFPWLFVFVYFMLFLLPESSSTGRPLWEEAILTARFASPTSAGILFSMLAAAGLAGTWAFSKTRILAIFDDLDTVLFMIPLTAIMVGFRWQLGAVLAITALLLFLGFRYYRKLNLPSSWQWVLGYAVLITAIGEVVYLLTLDPATHVSLHIEVLLPAFLLGCVMKPHRGDQILIPGEDPPGDSGEERAGVIISCIFLLLVGLAMPAMFGENAVIDIAMTPGELAFHVLMVTILANLGKMFILFTYKGESTFRERLAVSVAMWPRGEVGAGVLAVALSYGIQGPFVAVSFLSLALNLLLTGLFIVIVKWLLAGVPNPTHGVHHREQPREVAEL